MALTTKSVAVTSKSVVLTTKSVALTTKSVALTTKSVALTSKSVVLTTKSVVLTTKSVVLKTKSVAVTTKSVALITKSVALTSKSVQGQAPCSRSYDSTDLEKKNHGESGIGTHVRRSRGGRSATWPPRRPVLRSCIGARRTVERSHKTERASSACWQVL